MHHHRTWRDFTEQLKGRPRASLERADRKLQHDQRQQEGVGHYPLPWCRPYYITHTYNCPSVTAMGAVKLKPDHPQSASALTKPFDPEEHNAALCTLKPRKAAGIDDVLAETACGTKSKDFVLEMLNSCLAMKTSHPHREKPKQSLSPNLRSPENSRLIFPFCITYKLYERL